MRRLFIVILVIATATVAAQQPPATQASKPDEITAQELARILKHSPLGQPPADSTNRFADDPRAAHLGQFLFFDPRLSGNGRLSCASCHDPQKAFADGNPVAEGVSTGTRNAPSLINVAYNRWLFWDGRSDSLWSQALHPIERPDELGSSRLQIAHLIQTDPKLKRAYESIFGSLPDCSDVARFPPRGGPIVGGDEETAKAWDGVSPADQHEVNLIFVNVGKAIEAYERKLVSFNSPFDAFADGLRNNDVSKQAAFPPAARRGLMIFVGRGECRLCHSGPNFTDGEFHDIGVPPRDGGPTGDPGRFNGITLLQTNPFNAAGEFSDDRNGPAAQRLQFLANAPQNFGQLRTPSLRNVALTAPYMHQGQFSTLAQVIDYYSTLQGSRLGGHHTETILRPRDFSKNESADLVVFLELLTDFKPDSTLLTQPTSPMQSDVANPQE